MNTLLLGDRTLEERTEFINRTALEYLMRHPERTVRYARRQARLRWRTKVNSGNV